MSTNRACELLGFSERKYYRWRKNPTDGRLTCDRPKPKRALSEDEVETVVSRYSQVDVRDLSTREAYLALEASGEYYCSLSTVQRIFKANNSSETEDNTSNKSGSGYAAPQYEADYPGKVVCWDITYLDIAEGNRKAYCFAAIDVYSRYIIAAETYEEQTAQNAVKFIDLVVSRVRQMHGYAPKYLHADNGSQMRSEALEKYCLSQGVTLSFSRPAKSDDNAIIESTFRTLKYPLGLKRKFANFYVCRMAVWYAGVRHNSRPHSAINDVTPQCRYQNRDKVELRRRKAVMRLARMRHRERFVNGIRNLDPAPPKLFNPHGTPVEEGDLRSTLKRHLAS